MFSSDTVSKVLMVSKMNSSQEKKLEVEYRFGGKVSYSVVVENIVDRTTVILEQFDEFRWALGYYEEL